MKKLLILSPILIIILYHLVNPHDTFCLRVPIDNNGKRINSYSKAQFNITEKDSESISVLPGDKFLQFLNQNGITDVALIGSAVWSKEPEDLDIAFILRDYEIISLRQTPSSLYKLREERCRRLAESLLAVSNEIVSNNGETTRLQFNRRPIELFAFLFPDGRLIVELPELSVNKIAKLPDGTILDPYNGIDDLKNGIARIVGRLEEINLETIFRVFYRKIKNRLVFDTETRIILDKAIAFFIQNPYGGETITRLELIELLEKISRKIPYKKMKSEFDLAGLTEILSKRGIDMRNIYTSAETNKAIPLPERLPRQNDRKYL